MSGILGKKVGMTSVFEPGGRNIVCTVIEAGPCVVTQVKTRDIDGYRSYQLGFGEKREKNTTKSLKGHFDKAGTTPKRHLAEFREPSLDLELGDDVRIEMVVDEGDYVDVIGKSKGKGFQGVVRRHNFKGVGDMTHGQHNRQRAPGSIGQSSSPSRVFKGMKMAGQMGNARVTVENLLVVRIFPEQNLLLVRGAVPGPKNGIVEIRKAE